MCEAFCYLFTFLAIRNKAIDIIVLTLETVLTNWHIKAQQIKETTTIIYDFSLHILISSRANEVK